MADNDRETPKARAARLMGEIGDGQKATYTKGEVKAILNSVIGAVEPNVSADGCRAPASINSLRRGDVFIAKAIGGKVRPWIVLRVSDGIVTAVSLSSGDSAPNMTRADCRYWENSWIGSTIAQFDMDLATAEVTRPYTNLAHLRDVERAIYQRMGATISGPRTLADVRIALADIIAGSLPHKRHDGTM